MNFRTLILFATIAALAAGHITLLAAGGDEDYVASIEACRALRLESITDDTGWLTIAGFAWLQEGKNRIGSDSSLAVVLPAGSAPEKAGVLTLDTSGTDQVLLTPDPGVSFAIDGKPVVSPTVIWSETQDGHEVSVGRITFWVIPRAGAYAIRLRDPESHLRTEFNGIDFFDVDPAYRVVGTLIPEPDSLEFGNVMGYTTREYVPGPVRFQVDNGTYDLFPIVEVLGPAGGVPWWWTEATAMPDTVLFFIFEDATTGLETYGGGRFLYTVLEPDGSVVLDFNKAYNPHCAYNPYLTCALPPPENKLPVALRAGEKSYRGGYHD